MNSIHKKTTFCQFKQLLSILLLMRLTLQNMFIFSNKAQEDYSEKPVDIRKVEREFLEHQTLQTDEQVYSLYNKVGHKPDKSKAMTEETYFQTHLTQLSCEEHIKFMNLDYRCVKESKLYFPRDMNLFLVMGNLTKYYMRLDDHPSKYSLYIQKSMKVTRSVLELVSHKIVKGRFVGIYRYENSNASLDYYIKTGRLKPFQLLSYMISLVKKIIYIFYARDNKNPYFKLNVLPTNLMIREDANYTIKMVRVLVSNQREIISNLTPEQQVEFHFIDNKKEVIYNLGKLFFYMIFRVFHTTINQEHLKFLDLFIEKIGQQEEESAVDVELVVLIRQMLNNYPVDRMTLEDLLQDLEGIRGKAKYQFLLLKDKVYMMYDACKREINKEMLESVYKQKLAMSGTGEKPREATNAELEGAINDLRGIFTANFSTEIDQKHKFSMILDLGEYDFLNRIPSKNDIRQDRREKIEQMKMKVKQLSDQDQFQINLRLDMIVLKRKDFKSIKNSIEDEYLLILNEYLKTRHIYFDMHTPHELHVEHKIEVEIKLVVLLCFIISAVTISSFFFKGFELQKLKKEDFTSFIQM